MRKISMRIRVEWAHCDPAKIIFNPHYYIWMDQGTHQLFYAAGFRIGDEIASTGFRGMPLVRSGLEFRTPAFYNDVITLESAVEHFGNTSFRVAHQFSRGDDLLAEGFETRIWGWTKPDIPAAIKAIRVPDELRERLSENTTHDVTP